MNLLGRASLPLVDSSGGQDLLWITYGHPLITPWQKSYTIFRQPRPQGAFPWRWRPTSKAREKRPGDEVVFSETAPSNEPPF